jgi:hypothetical protein
MALPGSLAYHPWMGLRQMNFEKEQVSSSVRLGSESLR